MERILNSVYQPVVNIKNHEILYYESLARVKNDDMPGRHVKLIEAGEMFGFIDLIDIAMLEKAIETVKANPDIRIAVNVSVMTIEKSLGDYLACAFRNFQYVPQIVFEITESVELRKKEMMHKFVSAIKLLGAKIAIDDFGNGYSNVELLNLVQPDFLKLPRSFIETAIKEPGNAAFKFINELMRRNHIEIIAEFIDSDEKLMWLHDAGINLAQGYKFGKFVEVDNLTFFWNMKKNQRKLEKLTA